MRILRAILPGLALILTACSPRLIPLPTQTVLPTQPPALETPAPGKPPSATHLPVDLTAAQRAALASLSQSLGVPADQIKIISTDPVTWPNGCLGVTRIGVLCTQSEVPGFKIILESGGTQYELHTNQAGTSVAPTEPIQTPDAAEQAAVIQLAQNLGIDKSQIKVVSADPIEFPDSCLGIQQQGVMCAQIVTPGYLIVLEANGRQYEYHTNENASAIMPASVSLIWTQQGGIAGLCQMLDVYLSGEIYGQNCKSGDGRMGVLSSADRKQLETWTDSLGSTLIDLSDPKGVADGMTRQATLNGTGQKKATDAQEHAIFAFGQKLYMNLFH